MTLDNGMIIVEARGKTPREAFAELFDSLSHHDGIYMTKLKENDWVVSLNVKPFTERDIMEWERERQKFYKKDKETL